MSSIDIPDIEFERPCVRCQCSGKTHEEALKNGQIIKGPLVRCPSCDGTGYVATYEGERLLTFLRHQGVIQ